jgi:hypothetical protein
MARLPLRSSGLGGLVVLGIVIVLAWWLLGAILSMSVGHLLLLIAAGASDT